MELDDFKQQWNATNSKHTLQNNNIMELIQHNSYGPLAALKRSFRKQMRIMTVLPILMLAVNANQADKTLTSVLFWFYVVFCIGAVVFAKANYNLVHTMEGIHDRVKPTLEQHVSLLENRLRQNYIGLRVVLLMFIILLEVLPYVQHFSMLDKWHSLSPLIRFGAYAGFFILQYFGSKRVIYHKFGQHIAHLKELLQQMQ